MSILEYSLEFFKAQWSSSDSSFNFSLATILLHLLFLILYIVVIQWRFIPHTARASRKQNSDIANGIPRTEKEITGGLSQKIALGSCVFLLVINLVSSLLGGFSVFCNRWSQCSGYGEGAAVIQIVTWCINIYIVRTSRGVRWFLFLKTWWIVIFLFSLSCAIAAKLVHNSFDVWVQIASLPAALILVLTAICCKPVKEATKDNLQEPLLSAINKENIEDRGENITPYSKAGWISLATIAWLNPLLSIGFHKPLDIKDVPLLAPQDRAEDVYKTFKKNWDKLKEEHPSSAPSISRALARSLWKQVCLMGLLAALTAVAEYVGPYLIDDFVQYLGGRRRFQYEGYTLVLCFFVANILDTFTQRQWWLGTYRLNLKVQASLTAIVFRKGLCLSSESRKHHTSGEIINYMAVDVARIGQFLWCIHDIWILPLQVGLALGILYRVVGIASLAALIATIATIMVNAPLVRLQEKYQEKLMSAKDARMKATSECLKSMRILKLQAWETRYLGNIEKLREVEYGWLAKDLYVVAFSTFLLWTAPTIVSVVTFGTCVLLGIPLTAGRILSAVATIRVLREPLRNFPDLAASAAQTKVSLNRLWRYLQEPELPVDRVERTTSGAEDLAFEVKDGCFSWNESISQCTLSGVNLQVKKGARVAVCGTVGSGKTSLLLCILGEIPKLNGTVKVSGCTAYVAQTAWIQSGTIEENIRFGSPMDRSRYETVLKACELKKDIDLFSFGDQTEIGERGINLSGGQKQRVQLARALYQDADVYFLDDPFSAVDAHTGSHLFKECIMGLLECKTVVYVTHQVDFLPAADLILVLRDGAIVQAGKYHDLLQTGTNFSSLVRAHNDAIDTLEMSTDSSIEPDLDSNISNLPETLHNSGEGSYSCSQDDVQILNGTYSMTRSDASQNNALRKSQENRDGKNVSKTRNKRVITPSQLGSRSRARKEIPDDKPKQLVKAEEREKGRVSFQVYWAYISAIANGAFVPVFLLAHLSFQILQILSNYWMAWGTPAMEGDFPRVSSRKLILVYTSLVIASIGFVLLRAITVSILGLWTAQKYFLKMLRSIFRAPMSFFDSTPSGRILNRMSADQATMDLEIQFAMSRVVSGTLQFVGIIVVMSQVTWQVLLVVFPFAGACIILQQYYIASGRELARLYSIQKSPIINHYGESIAGAATIRGFGQEERFMATNLQNFDKFATTYFHNTAAREWLILRMEVLSVLVFAGCMLLIVAMPRELIDSSMAGLAVTYGLNLNSLLAKLAWSICALENTSICVERIQQYCELVSEAPLVLPNCKPLRDWPSKGTIDVQNLQVRYNAHTPLVLHGLTCTIKGGKRVGIVGRTGSGKSTFIHALFRMVEPQGGTIMIDHLDIGTLGLHDLRSRMSIIPQEPTLFEGTLRNNLDPLEEHSDFEIWEALDKCQLKEVVCSTEAKLDTSVTENGENWSVGQRQLVCLGRALLKRTRIIVLDEATASVDSATDGIIRRTLQSEFKLCTVITVAHRIPTVIDSDSVLVLNDGRVSEYDTPTKLLENKKSLFSKLVAEYSIRSTNITAKADS